MHILEPVSEHRPIDFVKELAVNAHLVIRCNPQKVSVIGSVVDFAECKTIRNAGESIDFRIGDDVCGIE